MTIGARSANDDTTFLRRAFAVAKRAQTNGNHPFGCILVGPDGDILIESENGFIPDHMTAHEAAAQHDGVWGKAAP